MSLGVRSRGIKLPRLVHGLEHGAMFDLARECGLRPVPPKPLPNYVYIND